MGVALAMELLTDQTLQCGPLRAVFTVSEETGLGGAEDIDLEFLDADVLFNLDSDVTFTIGCAGGSRFMGSQKLSAAAPEENSVGLRFYLSGMQGGHSGVDIHRNVGSACRVMGDFLRDITDMGFAIAQVKAGTLHNAIAREAECSGAIAESELEKVAELVKAYNTLLNTQFEPAPGGQIVLTVEKIPAPNEVLTPDAQEKLLTVWDALPHGLLSVCPDGSAETSSNLAVVEGSCGSDWSFTLLVRSLYDAQREKVTGEALELLHANGFAGEVDSAYTSWEPKWDSPLLEMACAIYRDVMNKEPEKFVIHGGLEPGMFCGMNPKLQMLSFAPATQAVHSPQEKLSISDSEAVRKLLRALVERIVEL
jgi:dipeptidase D